MAVGVNKREGESESTLVYRFGRRVQQSGVLREAKKRRFHTRTINRNRRRKNALRMEKKRLEVEKAKKLGEFWK